MMEKKGETKKKKKVFFTKSHGIKLKETALLTTTNAGYLLKKSIFS
jgi:hypothetical protein